jgi:hypothetical protein
VLAVAHADGLVVDELAVAEMAMEESPGEAAHFAALLAGGTAELRLGEGLVEGQSGCGCGRCEVLEDGAASERALARGSGMGFFTGSFFVGSSLLGSLIICFFMRRDPFCIR